ncbi:helix-turn-helix domain-containing protein [Hyphomicrobium sp. xq]|uniref:Helix-turn-helix domain-containing protein n=1 Tax=Hyphomicrobium album TaxID=2665159 RepID=A0A6I3KFS7_9HYPH|nr:helix-turn-helix domain-containing protein [Hyphomicrobium album]MTD93223.1 helix-turn-helix domain-containing protein [Hyphomicrobium album]
MSIAFSTEHLHQHDRVPYWVDVATEAFFKHQFSAKNGDFAGSLTGDWLDNLYLSRCECTPCEVTRTRREAARDDIDDLILGVRVDGRSTISQDGRDHSIGKGTLYLQDVSKPLDIEFLSQSTTIFVSIPRKVLQARVGQAVTSGVVLPDHPIAGLAAEFIAMLSERASLLDDRLKPRLAEQALDLIALTLTVGDASPTLSSPRSTTLIRLKSMIDARINDPVLRPADVAAAAGISVRYANALLAEENTSVERYILHRRLEHCRRALEDPLQAHRMIGDIAFSWGFSDLSHFSRRFRARFGMTPGELRRNSQPQNAP